MCFNNANGLQIRSELFMFAHDWDTLICRTCLPCGSHCPLVSTDGMERTHLHKGPDVLIQVKTVF